MQIVAFASHETGVGKTTLAGHVAVQAERAGKGPVALLDADPCGDLAVWWNRRSETRPVLMDSSLDRLPADIEKIRISGFALLIVDTPQEMTAGSVLAMDIADLIVVPVRTGSDSAPADDMVNDLGKPVVLVANGVLPESHITVGDAVTLSQYSALAPVAIHRQTEIAASMAHGQTAMEAAPASSSAREVQELWCYLGERLRRLRSVKGAKPVMFAETTGGGGFVLGTVPVSRKGAGAPLRVVTEDSYHQETGVQRGGGPPGGHASVLVLALDPFNARVYHDLLEVRGYDAVTTDCVDRWMKALSACTPDLILIELCASDHPSTEVARAIARDPRFSAIPIVTVTDTLETNGRRNPVAVNFDCEGHIAKPISIRDFYGPIETILTQSSGRTAHMSR